MDSMITGAQPTMDEGIIKAVISYEDEAGNKTELEKELTLFVQEDTMGDMLDADVMEGMEEEPKAKPKWLIAVIILVVIILAVVGIVVFLNIKKKKKIRQS